MSTVWRIVVGLALVPAFGTLYQRLKLKESKRFLASKSNSETSLIGDQERKNTGKNFEEARNVEEGNTVETAGPKGAIKKKQAHFLGRSFCLVTLKAKK